MSALIVFAIFIVVFTVLKFLNVTSPPRPPNLFCRDSKFYKLVLKYCPHLNEPYVPVSLWGSSGHLQTLVHATLGRLYSPDVKNAKRYSVRQEDGATVTWDAYEPTSPSQFSESYTIAVCPGIANSSESAYVQALVALAGQQGYGCIVLNHLGVLSNVPVTSPRVFRYGQTDEYHLMLTKFAEQHPESKLVLVGFSMGGNIVGKYLGEQRVRSPNIVGAISICQGYDALRSLNYLLQWQNLARLYLYSMTENMRSVIRKHKDVLLTEEVKRKYNIDERKVFSAATLPELDDVYTRLVFDFRSVEELYRADSCSTYLEEVNVPIIFINARDDPLVHTDVLNIPEKFSLSKNQAMYIETEHGGHLGYYDGGFIVPKAVTWLDRTVVGLVSAIASNDSDC